MPFADLFAGVSAATFSLFAEPATVASVAVAGLFTEEVVAGEPFGTEAPTGKSSATLEVKPGDLPAGVHVGDTVIVRGASYTVVDITSDVCGNLKLVLHR